MKNFFFVIALLVSFAANAQMMGFGNGGFGGKNTLRGASETIEVEVVQVRRIVVKQQATMVRQAGYGATGAAIGGLLGVAVKNPQARQIAAVLGGLGGGAIGAVLASPRDLESQEIIFREVGTNRLMTVVQADSNLSPGQRAFAMVVGGALRLAPITESM